MDITIDKAVLEQVLEWFEWFHNGSTIASPASSTQVMRTLREALTHPEHQSGPDDMALVPQSLLDAFPEINPSNYDHDDACELNRWGCEVVTSVKAAPQPQPVQHPEPFQVLCDHCDGSGNDPKNNNYGCAVCGGGGSVFRMLYTSPQAQPQPVQEPVAPVGTVTRYLGNDGYMKWAFQPEAAAWLVPRDQRAAERGAESCFSVYASPQAQPLSDEQIADAYEAMSIQNHLTWAAYLAGARHAEAAHGIKGTK